MTRYQIAEQRHLCGGFSAMITSDECNLWHEYITIHPLFLQCNRLEDERDVLRAKVNGGAIELGDQLASSIVAARAALESLYVVGKAWYAELVKGDPEREKAEFEQRQQTYKELKDVAKD